MVEAPKLSHDLDRFADELERIDQGDYAPTREGIAQLRTAMAGVMRMFALEARTLEADLDSVSRGLMAAECRIEALTIPDYLTKTRHNIAVREGVASGKIIDLREAFDDEREFNAARYAGKDEGSAA